jgi:hypothetical protein
MDAGRELDALVAEKIFGYEWRTHLLYGDKSIRLLWHPDDDQPRGDDFEGIDDLPCFSTNINAAWQVVEEMQAQARNLQLVSYCYGRTYASFGPIGEDEEGWREANGEHATPHAICLAALDRVSIRKV